MYSSPLPTYFISHGGGPWPWLKKEMPFYDKLEASLQAIPKQLGVKPKAILIISAHWEAKDFAIMSNPLPPMVYDYGGFPEQTYYIKYKAPGSPELAQRVEQLIAAAGLPAHLDPHRGFDHGTFVPLFVMYPDASVPVVQLSLRQDLNPSAHFQLGVALAPLRQEGVLILGSGLSYHNLSRFDGRAKPASKAFDSWLSETLSLTNDKEVEKRLIAWEQAPSARQAHPKEEHLIPLLVAYGAARGEMTERFYHEENFMGGIVVSSFRFGRAAEVTRSI